MYPQWELKKLATARDLLSRRISAHRRQCVEAATVVAAPLALIDRGLAVWRQLAPLTKLATVPLASLFRRKLTSVTRVVDTVLHWAPVVRAIFQGHR